MNEPIQIYYNAWLRIIFTEIIQYIMHISAREVIGSYSVQKKILEGIPLLQKSYNNGTGEFHECNIELGYQHSLLYHLFCLFPED